VSGIAIEMTLTRVFVPATKLGRLTVALRTLPIDVGAFSIGGAVVGAPVRRIAEQILKRVEVLKSLNSGPPL
jgi:hypothetical protein